MLQWSLVCFVSRKSRDRIIAGNHLFTYSQLSANGHSRKRTALLTDAFSNLRRLPPSQTLYLPPGGGGTQQSFIRGGSAPRSKPLPFYVPFLIEKVPLLHTSHRKWYPFHIPSWGFKIFCPFQIPKWQFSLPFPILELVPTLSHTSSLKKVPVSGGASPYSPLQGVPPRDIYTFP